MCDWTDAHNHLQDSRIGDAAPVIAAMKAAGITRTIVNATCENDWAAVRELAELHPDFIQPAYGIHPWKVHTTRSGWLGRLHELLESDPRASIGECGLDQWVKHPPLETQHATFIDQLELAYDLARPMTLHCLKAWAPLFNCFARFPPPPRFLMHSFGGSLEVAQRLIPLGAYFSFSGYFLHPRKSAIIDVFRALPTDRILLETDAPDMLPPHDCISHRLPANHNHPANLPAIGAALASALGLTESRLAELTSENARNCFGL